MSDKHITSSAYVGVVFAQSFDDEPPMSLDLGEIERTGARRLRRRRAFTMGGAALAVAAVTAGIAIAVPSVSSQSAVSNPRSVPGCATVLPTGDPAVLAWRNGGVTPAATTPPDGSTVGGVFLVGGRNSHARGSVNPGGPPAVVHTRESCGHAAGPSGCFATRRAVAGRSER